MRRLLPLAGSIGVFLVGIGLRLSPISAPRLGLALTIIDGSLIAVAVARFFSASDPPDLPPPSPSPALRVRALSPVHKAPHLDDRWFLGYAQVAQLRVRNEPDRYGPEAIARVVAEIRYTDDPGTTLALQGRWGDTPLPEHPDRAVEPIEIAPGAHHDLDIALQWDADAHCFALDNTSAFSAYRVREHALDMPVVVAVHIRGNVDARWVLHAGRPRRDADAH